MRISKEVKNRIASSEEVFNDFSKKVDQFINSGMMQQLSGFEPNEFRRWMSESIPATANPVVLALIKGMIGISSESSSYGTPSKYMTRAEAKAKLDAFRTDRNKMAIWTSPNHPKKEEMKAEYRRLAALAQEEG
jgi:hypothetical protein